jgi:hypothetical protein
MLAVAVVGARPLSDRDDASKSRLQERKRQIAMANKIIAELLVETLVAAGVNRVFGVAGDSLNAITDTIRKRKDIDWILVRHEEVAAFCRRCSRTSNRVIGGMRRQLRPGKHASD